MFKGKKAVYELAEPAAADNLAYPEWGKIKREKKIYKLNAVLGSFDWGSWL